MGGSFVLDKEGLINVLAITVRYFGGIKLGAGGLVRAYSKSVRDAVIASDLVDVVKGYRMNVIISYDMQKNLDYLLKNYAVVNKQFNDKVIYTNGKYKVIIKDSLDYLVILIMEV